MTGRRSIPQWYGDLNAFARTPFGNAYLAEAALVALTAGWLADGGHWTLWIVLVAAGASLVGKLASLRSDQQTAAPGASAAEGRGPRWCRILGHTWIARSVVVFNGRAPGDLICRTCGATTWSTR